MYVVCPNTLKHVVNSSIATFSFNLITTTTLNYIVLYNPLTFRQEDLNYHTAQEFCWPHKTLEPGDCGRAGRLPHRCDWN